MEEAKTQEPLLEDGWVRVFKDRDEIVKKLEVTFGPIKNGLWHIVNNAIGATNSVWRDKVTNGELRETKKVRFIERHGDLEGWWGCSGCAQVFPFITQFCPGCGAEIVKA